MQTSRQMLPRNEYQLSELRDIIGVSPVTDSRSMHTLFATLLYDIDKQANINQSIKPDIVSGVVQAWLYVAEEIDGVNVEVEQRRHGINTTVSDPSDGRPVSTIGRQGSEDSQFDESLRARPDSRPPLDRFERDMRRLDDLRRKYSSPGLNTCEGEEAEELRDKYGLSHREWWQGEYLADSGGN